MFAPVISCVRGGVAVRDALSRRRPGVGGDLAGRAAHLCRADAGRRSGAAAAGRGRRGTAGDLPALLSELPQPESEGPGHRPDRVRHVEPLECRRRRGRLGTSRAEGSHRSDAAGRQAASRRGGARRLRELGRVAARCRRGGPPQPGTNRDVPSSESRRIPERRSRSARSRRQRRLAASRRRRELRVRQHGRRAEDVADADGAVSGRGAEDQPPRGGHAAAVPQRRVRAPRRRSPAGRAHRGTSRRDARRGVDSLRVSHGRGVRDQGAARPRHPREHRRLRRRPAPRSEPRRGTRAAVHGAGLQAVTRGAETGGAGADRRQPGRPNAEPNRPPAQAAAAAAAAAPAQGRGARPRPSITQVDTGPRLSAKERQQRNHIDDAWDVRLPREGGPAAAERRPSSS